jgi:hypothetical protein
MNLRKRREKQGPREKFRMKKFSEKFYKKSETVKLSLGEKKELRERLISYMEYHPLPVSSQAPKILREDSQKNVVGLPFRESFRVLAIPYNKIFRASALVAVFILIGVPFMAERSVPGDTLYAVKVQFNEELRSTLIFDSYQKVEWETERLNRRIAEARLLASEGRLTDAVEAEVAEAVMTHTQNVKNEIEDLRVLDADEAVLASISLETTLEVQSSSFKNTKNKTPEGFETGVDDVTPRDSLISGALEASRQQADNLTEEELVLPSYEKLMARVEMNTTRLFELKDSLRGTITDFELAEVNRRAEDISRSVQEAILLATEDLPKAQAQLVDVLQRTQKLIVYMTELEVKETVDIEVLVPVVLTSEEKTQKIESSSQELELKVAKIIEDKERVEEVDVVEKIDYSLDRLDELVQGMESNTNDFGKFMTLYKEASALADDTLLLISNHTSPVISSEPIIDTEAESSDTIISEDNQNQIEDEDSRVAE